MDFSYPAEVEQFRKELRTWLSANLTEDVREADRHRGRDVEAFETLRAWDAAVADAGWGAVSWPQEYGGRGATVLEQLVYAEETTRARAPVPLNVIGMNNIAPAIMTYGTETQKRTLLPRMARADDIWCQGMSEPEAGSDLASLRTRAVRDGSGPGADFVVNGQKIWTSLGHRADWCQLYVRTDPEASKHKGISCLIVDMGLPGIEARPLVTLNGAADFAEVFFNDVRVPADALLGPLDAGWQVATTTLSHERAGAARLYAQVEVQLADLVADLAGHSVNGRPVLEDSGTLRRLGELAVRINYLELLCKRSISATLHGGDALGSASLAKSVWAELGQDLAALAYDVLGHTNQRWVDRRLSTRSLTIAGGTTQITKGITATRVLGIAEAMNLELTAEQIALRDTVRQFLAEKASVASHVRPMLDDPTGSSDEVWHGLAGLGATGVLVPAEHDGAGMTMVEAGVVAEELGAALYPGPWLSTAVAATRALTRTGADGGLLAGIADGTVIATVGGVTGRRPAADGGVLRGELTAVPDVGAAGIVLVVADGAEGPALYSVDPASDGVTTAPRSHVDATHKSFDVALDGVTARRLADAPDDAVQALADDIIIARAADALGAANAVMHLAVDYAKVRRQFDQPIGSFQAVQHLCVDMYESVELARSGVVHALWAADAADATERHRAAVNAKAFAGRLTSVGDTAIQVFGGIGFTWDHDAHLYLKRLLGWSAFLGAPDRYLEEVGANLVSEVDRKVLR